MIKSYFEVGRFYFHYSNLFLFENVPIMFVRTIFWSLFRKHNVTVDFLVSYKKYAVNRDKLIPFEPIIRYIGSYEYYTCIIRLLLILMHNESYSVEYCIETVRFPSSRFRRTGLRLCNVKMILHTNKETVLKIRETEETQRYNVRKFWHWPSSEDAKIKTCELLKMPIITKINWIRLTVIRSKYI